MRFRVDGILSIYVHQCILQYSNSLYTRIGKQCDSLQHCITLVIYILLFARWYPPTNPNNAQTEKYLRIKRGDVFCPIARLWHSKSFRFDQREPQRPAYWLFRTIRMTAMLKQLQWANAISYRVVKLNVNGCVWRPSIFCGNTLIYELGRTLYRHTILERGNDLRNIVIIHCSFII